MFVIGPDDDPDKYRLRRQVGGGGEAELWEADVALAGQRERVAVKILRPEHARDPRWRQRWAEQVELLRLLRHPGIVGVHAQFEGARMHLPGQAGEQAERAVYLVMNWIDGQDLREWVPQHRALADRGEALRLLGQVAAVLDWLHSGQATPSGRPVVHGDISPANVVVTPTGQAVLVDFGLFRIARHVTEVPAGTRGYAAPEVISRGEYSPASDRYAFGGLAYYVLTGSHPPVDPERLRAGLATIEALAEEPVALDELAAIFSGDPSARPSAGDWIRLLRLQASTATALTVPVRPLAEVPPGPVRPAVRSGPLRSPWLAAAASGLLVAAIALAINLLSPAPAQDRGDGGASTPPATDVASPSSPPLAPSPTLPDTSPPPGSPSPPPSPTPDRWPGWPTGTILITGNVEIEWCSAACTRHFDLDRNRGTIFDGRSETDLTADRDGVGAQGGAQVAPWPQSRPPTMEDCWNLPDQEWLQPFIPAAAFEEPSTYCVWTNGGRYGYLQTRQVGRVGFHFHYLLWQRPDDR